MAMIIIDKEKPLHGGMKSTIDGKIYTSRSAWDDHLRANNCRQYEKDSQRDKGEMKGNFDCRKELTEATRAALRNK